MGKQSQDAEIRTKILGFALSWKKEKGQKWERTMHTFLGGDD